MSEVKTEIFPNQATEVICSLVENVATTITDIKGALETGNPIKERESIFNRLIQIAVGTVDWAFVEEWLKKPMSTELIKEQESCK